jgi:hypothetical protein
VTSSPGRKFLDYLAAIPEVNLLLEDELSAPFGQTDR